MRIAVFVGAILIANALTIGGGALIALSGSERTESLIWLPIVSLMVVVYGPLVLGSLVSYWDVRASPEAWRYFRRWFVVSYALQALGGAAIVVFSVLTGALLWLPIAFVGAAVLLDLLALRIGRALRRREESRRTVEQSWQPISRESIVRRILIIAGVFALVLLVGSVGFPLLFDSVDARHGGIGIGLMSAAEFAFLAAALACVVVSLPLNRMLRENVTRDVGSLRAISKVVLRGRSAPLRPDETVAAAKYAVVSSVSLPFTLAYLALFYVALGIQQIDSLLVEPGRVFPVVLVVFLVVMLVVFVPLYVVRIRRARAYARAHAQDLPAVGAPGDTAVGPRPEMT